MLGKSQTKANIFQMVTMEDLVPQDYFYRKVNQQIDFTYVREIVSDKYCLNNGRPSKAPELIIRMMLIGYFENISELKLSREIKMHAGYRWFCGLDFNDEVPDRTTLIKTRQRWGIETFDLIFRQIVAQCITYGLVKGNLIAIDGTQVESRAATNSLEAIAPVISIEEYLHRFDEDATSDEPPKPPRQSGDQDFHGEKFSNQTHRSKTDPDSRLFRKGSGKEAKLSYLVHDALNVKSGVIMDTEATQANGNTERETALVFLKNLGRNIAALMDKNYRAADFLSQICSYGVQPMVPMDDLKLEDLPIWRRRTFKLDVKRKRNKLYDEIKARNYARILNRKPLFRWTYRFRIKIEHKWAEAKDCHGLDRARGYGWKTCEFRHD